MKDITTELNNITKRVRQLRKQGVDKEVCDDILFNLANIEDVANTQLDPRHLGIPNICFSLTDNDDKRESKFIAERLERGFDESETWSLCTTIASFIIPRLEAYEEIANRSIRRDDELIEDIGSFLLALKLLNRDNGLWLFSPEEEKQVEAGLAVFPKIFLTLWW